MSFILDALQKLEEKRHNESAPDIMTNHIEGRSKQEKRPLLTFLLVAVLLLNSVALVVWLRPQQEETNSIVTQDAKENIAPPVPAVLNINEAVEKNETPQKPEVVDAPAPDIVATENSEVAIETAALPIKPSPEEISDLKNKIAEEQLLVNASPLLETALKEESAPAVEKTVLDISQLPDSIRKELPDLSIAGHIYSNDPMSRIVNINGNVLREGDTVTSGLKVNEITMSGVVLDYEEVLFHIRAF